MKCKILILVLVLNSIMLHSQIVFNKIIEDTVVHIPNSIISIDTGYIMLSGTLNESQVRSFSFSFIDTNGTKIWKKVYGNENFEYWEGVDNNLNVNGRNYLSTGTCKNLDNNYRGIHYSVFDSVLNLDSQYILLYDTIWRKAFNTVLLDSQEAYITGQSYNYESSQYQLLIVKVDSNKNIVWEKSYGNRYEAGFQIIETSDKNVLVGGLTFSFPTTVTDEDWYLIKVDTAGNVIWERGYGSGSRYDGSVSGIIETQDSNYIACGGYPAFEAAGNNYFDGCLRKVSRDGDLMWTKYYRLYSRYSTNITTMKDYINSIYEDDNGYLFTLSSTYDAKPFYRGALTKMDCNGNIMFRRIFYAIDEFSNEQFLTVMKPTNDGGFILAGYGNSYDWYGYSPPQQAWLVKTDSLGIDGLCYSEPPELNIDLILPESVNCNDTITVYAYIAGKSGPYTIETSIGQVIDSIFYPPKFVPIEIGLSETSVEIGGIEYFSELITEATLTNHEWGQCIAKPIEFYTPHTSGSQQITIMVTDTYGESKMILKDVFVNDCGSGIAEEEINSVNLYPNPAMDNLYLDITEMVVSAPLNHLTVNCEIYNSMGQLVETVQLSNDLTVINVKDFAKGIYVLKINSESKTYSLSFEKE